MNLRTAAAVTAVFIWGVSAAQAQVTVNLVPGNFNYQFADHTTGQPISNLSITSLGDAGRKSFDVYLIQTGGNITYTNPQTSQQVVETHILQNLGVEGLGVRLLYNTPTGVTRVGNTGATTAQMQTAINGNIVASNGTNFDVVTKNGSTSSPPYSSAATQGTDTSTNAQTTMSLVSNPLVFPGTEDPLNPTGTAPTLRILIGTFFLRGDAPGTETVQAVDPFAIGNQNLTGPVPPTDATGQPNPPDGFHGEVKLDQYLAQNVGGSYANLNAATLTVSVTPEPSTLALGTLAAAGIIGWRRRRAAAAAAA
jgi:MYXO-CTERM domain-containing protein